MKMMIQKKISLGIAFLILVLTLIGNYFVYRYCYNLLVSNGRQLNEQRMLQCTMGVNAVLQDTRFLAQSICVNPKIQEFMLIRQPDYYQTEDMVQELKNTIKLRMYIRSAAVIKGDQTYWSYSPYEAYFKQLLSQEWYQEMEGENNGFSRIHPIKISREQDFITYKCDIFDSGEPVIKSGELLLNIEAAQLNEVIEGFFGKSQDFLIYDLKNQSVLLGGGDWDLKAAGLCLQEWVQPGDKDCRSRKYQNGYVTCQSLEDSHWIMAVYTSKSQILKTATPIRSFFLLYTPLTVMIVALAVYLYIRHITVPISSISRAMLEFSAGKKPNLNIRTGDELEVLSRQFNNMVVSIENYVEQKVQDEKIKKKIKFDMLMSKIHPHFLYNTLSSVIYLARMNRNQDIETMVKSLILILQDGMAAYSGKISASIMEELSVVKAYGAIQSFRYQDKFQILCNVNPDVQNAYIPKNILQPLVENAIYHGIAPCEEAGVVEIQAELENGRLRLCISDTGTGMPEDTLKRVKEGMEGFGGGVHSIGMGSIRDRLEYLYPKNYSFEIYSEINKGTIVLIRIPYLNCPLDNSMGNEEEKSHAGQIHGENDER